MGLGLRFLVLFVSFPLLAETTVNFSDVPAKMMGFGSFAKDIQKLMSPELRHYGKTLGAFFSAPAAVQALMLSDAYIEQLSELNNRMGEMEFVHITSADVGDTEVRVEFQVHKYQSLKSSGAIIGKWNSTGSPNGDVTVSDVRLVTSD